MSEITVKVELLAERETKKHTLPEGSKIEDLLEIIGQNPETLVVKRNDKITPENDELEDGDEIKIVPVVSGG